MLHNENNKTRMEKTQQLKGILTDLDNKELTKHQAHFLICDLFSVSITEGKLCEICECNDATLITEHCQNCDEYIINGEHN